MNGNGKVTTVDNYIGGKFVPPTTAKYLDVVNPADGHVIGKVGLSESDDVQTAVEAANTAFLSWSNKTTRSLRRRSSVGIDKNDTRFGFCFSQSADSALKGVRRRRDP